MRFEWDPRKAAQNRWKHGVPFEEACTIFADASVLSVHDDEHSSDEDRWASMGLSQAGRIIVVIHTWPAPDGGGEEQVRIISSRKANQREQRVYLRRKT